MFNIENHVKQLIKEEVAKAMAKTEKMVPEKESVYTEDEACNFLLGYSFFKTLIVRGSE